MQTICNLLSFGPLDVQESPVGQFGTWAILSTLARQWLTSHKVRGKCDEVTYPRSQPGGFMGGTCRHRGSKPGCEAYTLTSWYTIVCTNPHAMYSCTHVPIPAIVSSIKIIINPGSGAWNRHCFVQACYVLHQTVSFMMHGLSFGHLNGLKWHIMYISPCKAVLESSTFIMIF